MQWAFKLGLKLLFSRLPIPYSVWKSLGAFRHGKMDSADYALKIFLLHTQRAFPAGIPDDLVFLELGPGDSAASALIAFAYRAKQTILVDVGDFVSRDSRFYIQLAEKLSAQNLRVPQLKSVHTFDEVLAISRASYLTQGLESLHSIPTASVDFIWSHSVLEHVRKADFQAVLLELKRILRPGGFASHNIDFQDHLVGSLNNLRFSEPVWESEFFVRSGFYTNRIPAIRMHALFAQAGFKVCKEGFGRWGNLPVPRKSLHADFQQFSDAELINRTSHVLLSA